MSLFDDISALAEKWSATPALKEAQRWLSTTDKVLAAAYHARGGNVVSQVLAGASVTGAVLNAFIPQKSAHDRLSQRDFKVVETSIGMFFCDALYRSSLPRSEIRVDEQTRIVTWQDQGTDVVAAVYDRDDFLAGPYVLDGDSSHLSRILSRVTWASDRDLVFTASVSQRGRRKRSDEDTKYRLDVMPPASPYIGEPGVDYYVQRLRDHEKRGRTVRGRSMLLVGPSGVGKGVLARNIAQQLRDSEGRILEISNEALSATSTQDVIDLATYLQPSILLLDDLDLFPGEGTPDMLLALLEAIYGKVRLLIGTVMHQDDEDAPFRYRFSSNKEPGSLYVHGIRPGRIDEIYKLDPPGDEVRERLLLSYLDGIDISPAILRQVVRATAGLTGAYLSEVAHRIRIHGLENWKKEVVAVKTAAFVPRKKKKLRRKSIRQSIKDDVLKKIRGGSNE